MEWFERIKAAREAIPKLSQRKLGDAVGLSQAMIGKIEIGKVQSSEYMAAIIERLGLERSDFPDQIFEPSNRGGARQAKAETQPVPEFARDPAYWAMAAGLVGDVPLYASAEGGAGSLLIERDPIGTVKRPPLLQGVKDGYAIRIFGTSMVPEFEPNDTLFVNPRWPVSPNSPCVFYAMGDGDARATVKRYVSQTDDTWRVEQHKPHRRFELSKTEWTTRHCIVAKHFSGA